MDFEQGFTVLRALGRSQGGDMLAFSALTAIHWTHRLGALILFIAVAGVSWQLFGAGSPTHRRWAGALLATVVWQFLSGLGNVVLGWPLAAALAHTAGAAALIVLLTTLLARAHPVRRFSLATA